MLTQHGPFSPQLKINRSKLQINERTNSVYVPPLLSHFTLPGGVGAKDMTEGLPRVVHVGCRVLSGVADLQVLALLWHRCLLERVLPCHSLRSES